MRQDRKVLWVAVTCYKLSVSLRLAVRKGWKKYPKPFPLGFIFSEGGFRKG